MLCFHLIATLLLRYPSRPPLAASSHLLPPSHFHFHHRALPTGRSMVSSSLTPLTFCLATSSQKKEEKEDKSTHTNHPPPTVSSHFASHHAHMLTLRSLFFLPPTDRTGVKIEGFLYACARWAPLLPLALSLSLSLSLSPSLSTVRCLTPTQISNVMLTPHPPHLLPSFHPHPRHGTEHSDTTQLPSTSPPPR